MARATSTADRGAEARRRNVAGALPSVPRSTALEGVHSSRRRRETYWRQSVRPIASSASTASNGRHARPNSACPRRLPAVRSAKTRCWRHDAAGALRAAASSVSTSTGTKISSSRNAVHQRGSGSTVQPSTNNANSAGATRLRRRLSKIFQRDSGVIGFASPPPPGRGTRNQSQRAICQSPRIQRWRRFMSAT